MTNFDSFKRAGIEIMPLHGLDSATGRVRLRRVKIIFALDVSSGVGVPVLGNRVLQQFRAGSLEERVTADDCLAVSLDFVDGEVENLIAAIAEVKGAAVFTASTIDAMP